MNFKRRIYKWLFRLSKKIATISIKEHGEKLSPQYLLDRGWIEEDGYYIEPNVKDRDRISISFGPKNYYYRVFHSTGRVFIALEATVEWFELYYLLARINK